MTGRYLLRAVAVGGLSAVAALAGAQVALATNATNFIGHSAASSAMGGADSVSMLDTSAINANPASLSLMANRADPGPHDVLSAAMMNLTFDVLQPFLHHRDVFGSSRDGENEPFLALHGGVAVRFSALPRLTFGLGLFSQGALGSDLRGLTTAFGTRDDVSSYLRYMKLAAAVSYQATDKLAIGIAPHIGYSDITLQLFPKTSSNGRDGVPGTADDFVGIDIPDECARNSGLGQPASTCPWDVVFGVKAGFVYKLSPEVTVGAAYTSPVDFHYRDGRMKLNFSNLGLGRVEYDVDIEGITWPQQVEVGVAAKPTPRLLLALDLAWHNWQAFNTAVIHATRPNRAPAPPDVRIRLRADFVDQWVAAVGGAYDVLPELTLRAGYNFGNNPIPDRTLSPARQVVLEHHVAAGAGYRLGQHWQLDGAFVYALPNSVRYTNRDQPFGPNAQESVSGLSATFTVGYRF